MPARESPPPSASKFRHVFGQLAQRKDSYDWGPGRASALAVNPKFVAASIEGNTGGQILNSRIEDSGKFVQISKLSEHRATVTDLKWNPFNDNVLASCSADNSIKIWHVLDDGSGHCVRTLNKHSRRVEQIEWHTTVDDVIISRGQDSRIVLWHIASNTVVFEVADFPASCVAFCANSSLFAATSRTSHRVTIFDSRTGDARKSCLMPHDGSMPPKVIFPTNKSLITFGNTKHNRRQFAVFSLTSFSAPLKVVDIDEGTGQLLPLLDVDLGLVFITGKGDTVTRFYETAEKAPYVSYLGENQQQSPHTVVASMPKRALNLFACEVFRMYRVSAQNLQVAPLSIIVPRRDEGFHADLYPPTRGPTAALSFAEWKAGLDLAPVQLQLRTGMPVATCKPVLLKGEGELVTVDVNNDRKFRFLSQVTKADYRVISEREDCEEIMKIEEVKSKLLSSKENSISSSEFRSEEEADVTTASQISLDDVIHPPSIADDQLIVTSQEESKENEHTPLLENGPQRDGDEKAKLMNDEDEITEDPSCAVSETLPTRSSTTASIATEQSAPLAEVEDDASPRDLPEKNVLGTCQEKAPETGEKGLLFKGDRTIRAQSSAPLLEIHGTSSGPSTPDRAPGSVSTSARETCGSTSIRSISPSPLVSFACSATASTSEQPQIQPSNALAPSQGIHLSASARELGTYHRKVSPARSDTGTLSRPGTISPRVVSREPSREPDPRYHYDTPKWAQRNGHLGAPQYAHRCVVPEAESIAIAKEEKDNGNETLASLTARSELAEGDSRLLENAVSLLEQELRKSDARMTQLERLVQLQQQDIESLRFEIDWKDDRISYLQKQLAKMEAKVPAELRTPEEEAEPQNP